MAAGPARDRAGPAAYLDQVAQRAEHCLGPEPQAAFAVGQELRTLASTSGYGVNAGRARYRMTRVRLTETETADTENSDQK